VTATVKVVKLSRRNIDCLLARKWHASLL
jgi:hypothetical protein